jgi:hypothetical protein
LYLTGYSEGGAYALQAARMMHENPRYASALDVALKLALPMSGVFDLTRTMLPYLFDNVSATQPVVTIGSDYLCTIQALSQCKPGA